MKKLFFLFLVTRASMISQAQVPFDSITISRCSLTNEYFELAEKWPDKIRTGEFKNFISEEKTVWTKPSEHKEQIRPTILLLVDDISVNGTQDVSRCFIPRHSINFYSGGKITRCLLVCFQCDGLHFNDDPQQLFIKSAETRGKEMLKLKELFKDLL